jgi:hypothetical protein
MIPGWLQVSIAIPVVLVLPFLFALLLKLIHWLGHWTNNPFRLAVIWYLTTLLRVIEWAGREPEE